MAPNVAFATDAQEETPAGRQAIAPSTLTDWQRRRILIAAAATAAVGAPVRILDIRPADAPEDRWSRKVRFGSRPPAARRARPRPVTAPLSPEPQIAEEEQTP